MRILRVALAVAAVCAACACFVADAAATPETFTAVEPEPTPTSIVRFHTTAPDVSGPDYGSGLRATGAVLVGVAVVAGVAFLLVRPRR